MADVTGKTAVGTDIADENELLQTQPPSMFKDIVKRFARNRLALVSFFVLLFIALVAILAEVIAPYDPYVGDFAKVYAPPSPEHLFGCDESGRDIFTRIIYGARVSLTVGFVAVGISTSVSIIIGLTVAYYGKLVDTITMRFLDMLMAFPSILFAIIMMSVFGKGLDKAILAITIVGIPGAVRMVRATAMSVKETDYIQAAMAIGCNDIVIMFKHILPNILAPIIVGATMSISGTILSTAALGFLGLGMLPPTAEWGYMLSMGRNAIFVGPHLILFPGIAISITVLSFNLFGDGLRDALDPRLK